MEFSHPTANIAFSTTPKKKILKALKRFIQIRRKPRSHNDQAGNKIKIIRDQNINEELEKIKKEFVTWQMLRKKTLAVSLRVKEDQLASSRVP